MNMLASSSLSHDKVWRKIKEVRADYLEASNPNNAFGMSCYTSDFSHSKFLKSKNLTDQLIEKEFPNLAQEIKISEELFKIGGEMFVYLTYCPNNIDGKEVRYLTNLFKETIDGPIFKSFIVLLKITQKGAPFNNNITFNFIKQFQKLMNSVGFQTNDTIVVNPDSSRRNSTDLAKLIGDSKGKILLLLSKTQNL